MKVSAFKHRFIPGKGASADSPLLILVHGRTGNLEIMRWFAKRFEIPNLNYLLIQAPVEEQKDGPAQLVGNPEEPGYSWYLYEDDGEGRAKFFKLDDSRVMIRQMIEELLDQGLVSERIFWMGFSQGAAVGLDYFLRGPRKMGGFIGISGFCIEHWDYPGAFGPFAKQQRLFITHGTRDEILPWERFSKTYEHIQRLGVEFEFHEFSKPHSFELRKEIPLIRDRLTTWVSGLVNS